MFWPFWNRTLEFPNVETVDRLAWMAPFLLLPNPLLAQNSMIAAAVVGAGLAMLYAAKRLGAPTLLALFAAILFAYNPFVAVRLQHYFQLPGYAVLPAVLALWLRPYPRWTPLVLALLLSLGSTTPHYAVYLWALGGLWLLFDFSSAALKRFAATFGLYLLFNLYWLVPTALFTRAVDLVPSYPTWELLEQFARHATPAAVARLQGYWWPLVEVDVTPLVTLLGLGLLAAALVGLARPSRERLFLAAGALSFGLVALGTRVPPLAAFLSLSGPLATPLGWLFRDPAKAVGPLAALLLLLAALGFAGARGRTRTRATVLSSVLLAAYGTFALATTGPYLRAVYEPHTPPAAFFETNAWLEGRDGRVLWLPQYNGAHTFWNGSNLTPEFPTHSSALPVLDPYYYDGRSVVSYLSLYFGVLLRKVDADLSKVLRAWGTRWLVHHRDLPPYRLQPKSAFNNQVELLPPSLASQALYPAVSFSPLTVYDAGAAPPSYRPDKVSLSNNPLAALVTLTNWPAYAPERWSFVETPHEGVQDVVLTPGGDARVLLAESYSVDLTKGTVHYDPEHRWSKLGETTLQWWPNALLAGLPADERATLLLTRATGVRLELPTDVPAGAYRVLVRVYQGPEAGAVRLGIGEQGYTLDLTAPALRTTWLDLGELSVGDKPSVALTNLDGFNALVDFKFIPVAAWARAGEALTGLGQTWVWPSSALCRDLNPSEAAPVTVASEERSLPFSQPFAGARRWDEYHRVTLQVYGDGQGTPVELWTEVQGVWVYLGSLHTWWQGWRSSSLPVKPKSFVFAPAGALNAATNLKVIVSDGHPGGARVRVRRVKLAASQTCSLRFDSARATTATLSLTLDNPVALEVNGERYDLHDETPVKVDLKTGTNLVRLPLDAAHDLKGVLLSTEPLFINGGTASPRSTLPAAETCSTAWQLEVLEPLYLPGKRGAVADQTLRPVPVNYLRLGYWRPPGTCGALMVQNTWVGVGRYSLLASVVALAVSLLAFSAKAERDAR